MKWNIHSMKISEKVVMNKERMPIGNKAARGGSSTVEPRRRIGSRIRPATNAGRIEMHRL